MLSGSSLRQADHSSRTVLLILVCLSVIVKPRQRGGPGPLGTIVPRGKKSRDDGFIRSLIVACAMLLSFSGFS